MQTTRISLSFSQLSHSRSQALHPLYTVRIRIALFTYIHVTSECSRKGRRYFAGERLASSNHLANFAICYVRRVSAALFRSDANQVRYKPGLGLDWSNFGHKPGQFGTGWNWFDSYDTLADYPANGQVSQGGQVRPTLFCDVITFDLHHFSEYNVPSLHTRHTFSHLPESAHTTDYISVYRTGRLGTLYSEKWCRLHLITSQNSVGLTCPPCDTQNEKNTWYIIKMSHVCMAQFYVSI